MCVVSTGDVSYEKIEAQVHTWASISIPDKPLLVRHHCYFLPILAFHPRFVHQEAVTLIVILHPEISYNAHCIFVLFHRLFLIEW